MVDALRDRNGWLEGMVALDLLRDRSPNTVRDRRNVLRSLTSATATDLADMTPEAILSFLSTPGWTPATRKVYAAHIRGFYGWAHDKGLIPANPTRDLPSIRVRAGRPRPVPGPDFATALETAEQPVSAWLLLGYDAGLRCMETAGLHTHDVFTDEIRVVGKGRKVRSIPLTRRLYAELAPHLTGDRLWDVKPQTVGAKIRTHFRGLNMPYTAHQLRHSFGTNFYRASLDVFLTKQVMGHESAQTTTIYAEADMSKARSVIDAMTEPPTP